MKKNATKILTTVNIVIGIAFIIVLLTTIFGGIAVEDFNNSLVKGIFMTIGIIYILIATVTLILLFVNDEKTKEIVLRQDADGGTRTTAGVIKKITKNTIAMLDGVKCGKVTIVSDSYGVRLKLVIKIKEKDVCESEIAVRALLEDAFLGALNFKFNSIELKITTLKSKYTVNADEVIEKAKIIAENAAQEIVKEAIPEAEEAIDTTVTDDTEKTEAVEEPISDVAAETEITEEAEITEESEKEISVTEETEEIKEKAVTEQTETAE